MIPPTSAVRTSGRNAPGATRPDSIGRRRRVCGPTSPSSTGGSVTASITCGARRMTSGARPTSTGWNSLASRRPGMPGSRRRKALPCDTQPCTLRRQPMPISLPNTCSTTLQNARSQNGEEAFHTAYWRELAWERSTVAGKIPTRSGMSMPVGPSTPGVRSCNSPTSLLRITRKHREW